MTCKRDRLCRFLFFTHSCSLGWDKLFALMPYGEYWREHRKMFHQHFQPDAMTKHHVHISRQAKDLLRRLLAKPDDLIQNLRLWGTCLCMWAST